MAAASSSLYDILGVSHGASPAEMRAAYRTRVFERHPDQGGTAEQFAELRRAYETLSNEVRRREYDANTDDVAEGEIGDIFRQLAGGERLSEKIRDAVAEYEAGYTRVSLEDNMDTLVSVLNDAVAGATVADTRVVRVNDGEQEAAQQYLDSHPTPSVAEIVSSLLGTPAAPTALPNSPLPGAALFATLRSPRWSELPATIKAMKQALERDPTDVNRAMEVLGAIPAALRSGLLSAQRPPPLPASSQEHFAYAKKGAEFVFSPRASLARFTAPIIPPPSTAGSNTRCHICNVEFGIFTWKYACPACQSQHCSNCERTSVAPERGIMTRVKMCAACADPTKRLDLAWQALLAQLDGAPAEALVEFMAMLHASTRGLPCPPGKEEWRQLGNTLWTRGDDAGRGLGLQAMRHAGLEAAEWLAVVKACIGERQPQCALTVLAAMGSLVPPPPTTLAATASIDEAALAVLLWIHHTTPAETVLGAINAMDSPAHLLGLLYLVHMEGGAALCLRMQPTRLGVNLVARRLLEREMAFDAVAFVREVSAGRLDAAIESIAFAHALSGPIPWTRLYETAVTTYDMVAASVFHSLSAVFNGEGETYGDHAQRLLRTPQHAAAVGLYRLLGTPPHEIADKLFAAGHIESALALALTLEGDEAPRWLLKFAARLLNTGSTAEALRFFAHAHAKDANRKYLDKIAADAVVLAATAWPGKRDMVHQLAMALLRAGRTNDATRETAHKLILDRLLPTLNVGMITTARGFALNAGAAYQARTEDAISTLMQTALVGVIYSGVLVDTVPGRPDDSDDENDAAPPVAAVLMPGLATYLRHTTQLQLPVIAALITRYEASDVRHIQAAVALLRATQCRLQGQAIEAAEFLAAAVMAYPAPDTFAAVTALHFDPEFRSMLTSQRRAQVKGLAQRGHMPVPTPGEPRFGGILSSTPLLKHTRVFEAAIRNGQNGNAFETALSYFDMHGAVGHPIVTVQAVVLAALHLCAAMANASDARKYALWKVAQQLATQAFLFMRRFAAPSVTVDVAWQLLRIMLYADSQVRPQARGHPSKKAPTEATPILDSVQVAVIGELVRAYLDQGAVTILQNAAPLGCLDAVARCAISMNMDHDALKRLTATLDAGGLDVLMHDYAIRYLVLEGAWSGWGDDEAVPFDTARRQAMEALLLSKGWTMEDVSRTVAFPLIQRLPDGWLPAVTMPLDLYNGRNAVFRSIEGLTINVKTGEMSFLTQPATRDDALLSSEDLVEMVSRGITQGVMTLDQPAAEMPSHPFQEMRYGPAALSHSRYLDSMLWADYLLKMITTRTEVNCLPPFEMRDALSDGFLRRLPAELREAVTLERPANVSDVAHRFWLEPDEVTVYNDVVGDVLTVRFAPVRMRVKKHLLRRDERGNMIDDEADDGADDSPEARFVRRFTQHYDSIGRYFPELLRLKELVKVGILVNVLQGRLEQATELLRDMKRPSAAPFDEYLNKLRGQISDYPHYSSAKVNEITNDELRRQGFSRYDSRLAVGEVRKLENSVETALREADRKEYASILTAVSGSFDTPESEMRPYLDRWLNSRYDTSIITRFGIDRVMEKQRRPLQAMVTQLTRIGVSRRNEEFSLASGGECVYVPATYASRESLARAYRSYGGVNLSARVNQVQGSGGGGGGAAINRVTYREGNGTYSKDGHLYRAPGAGESGAVYGEWRNASGDRIGYHQTKLNPIGSTAPVNTYIHPIQLSSQTPHHVSLHASGQVNVHHQDGTRTVYKPQK